MIVPMRKVYVVSRKSDHEKLLNSLRELGVVHLQPVDPERAVAEEQTVKALKDLARAEQLLSKIEPAGDVPDVSPVEAATETMAIQRESAELRSRLGTLRHQLDQLEMWGDAELEQFQALRDAGLEVQFYLIDEEQLGEVSADCVEVVGEITRGVVVALVSRNGEPTLPEDAQPLELPQRDRPGIRAEAAEIDEKLSEQSRRLARLAHLAPRMPEAAAKLHARADYTVAQRSALSQESLFALMGWIPVDKAESLAAGLEKADLDAAVQTFDPDEEESPPTLIRYPRWARPIKALFKILGTTPGYREYDLAPFFMIAMPIFVAMIVGDAMYGLLFVLVGALGYRKLASWGGKTTPQMIIIFGAATVLWGMLTGNYFGVSPMGMIESGGFWAPLGHVLQPLAILWSEDPSVSRLIIIKISFVLGVLHLVSAHARRAVGMYPHPKFLSEVGWCSFLTGIFGMVWMMFDPDAPIIPAWGILSLLGAGAAMVILFSIPSRNIVKRLGLGLLSNLMPMVNTFGDTISYIRLMAVGLASYYIAVAFNDLAMDVASGGAALWAPAALVLIFAHALNVVLCLIAIFAHGVRLNMLEFSSNAGVQWAGYRYEPFAVAASNEGDA